MLHWRSGPKKGRRDGLNNNETTNDRPGYGPTMRAAHSGSFFVHVSNSKTFPRNLVPDNASIAACTSSAEGKVAMPVPLGEIVANLHSPPFWRSSFNLSPASILLSRSSMVGKFPIHIRFSGFSLQPLRRPLPFPLPPPHPLPPPPPPIKPCKTLMIPPPPPLPF